MSNSTLGTFRGIHPWSYYLHFHCSTCHHKLVLSLRWLGWRQKWCLHSWFRHHLVSLNINEMFNLEIKLSLAPVGKDLNFIEAVKIFIILQWGAMSPRWQYWSRIKSLTSLSEPNFFSGNQNNLAFHPGPVLPSGDDGSPLSHARLKIKWMGDTKNWSPMQNKNGVLIPIYFNLFRL